MVEVTKHDEEVIEKVENAVCKHFGVSQQDILNKDKRRDISVARSMCWMILHCEYKFSFRKIANAYYRNIRTVSLLIAKMKYQVSKQKMFGNSHAEILFELKNGR